MTLLPEYIHANETIPAHSTDPGAHVKRFIDFMFSVKNAHFLQACVWS